MSISKAQAKLLALNGLDSFGEGRGGFVPVETYGVAYELAAQLVTTAQHNLAEDNSNASGKLSRSIIIGEPKSSTGRLSLPIPMLKYGDYVDKGVKGTVSGTGQYSFKNNNPSPEMIKSLKASIQKASRKTKNTSRSKSTSRNEIKNQKTAEAKAWGAAVNIKKYGIRATGFMSKAIAAVEKTAEQRLGEAVKIDIYNSI